VQKTDIRGAWVSGASSDLLWGAGLGYGLLFFLMLGTGGWLMSVVPPSFMMFLVVLVSMPHYGATILRVYERGEDRRRYSLFSKHSTVLLALLFLWGVRDVAVGSLLFTLYLTWSPWHYTGQNYGIALLFLGRHGIPLDPRAKALLRSSFWLSYAVTFLFIHSPYTFDPFRSVQVRFLSLNLPAMVADVGIFVTLLGYGVTTAVVIASLLRAGGRRAAPALVLIGTQSLWFVVPAVVKNWLPYVRFPILTSAYDGYAFSWIALGHAAQYLWITAFFARSTKRSTSTASFYLKTLMAGSAVWAVPLVVFAPGLIGKLPYDVGLAAVTAAVVNLHHFVLDGAIWKLRDSRVGRVLLGPAEGASTPLTGVEKGSRLRWPLATAGVFSLALLLFAHAISVFDLGGSLERRDIGRAETAVERLAHLGQDSPNSRLQVGTLAMIAGDPARAARHFEAGVKLYPTSAGWTGLGEARESLGASTEAIEAFEKAIVLDPGNQRAQLHLALNCVETGQLDRARTILRERSRGDRSLADRQLRQRVEKLLAES
jgi:hypothetical protein